MTRERPIFAANSDGVAPERSRSPLRCSAKSRLRFEMPATNPCLFLPILYPPSTTSKDTECAEGRLCEHSVFNLLNTTSVHYAYTGDPRRRLARGLRPGCRALLRREQGLR